MWKPPACDKCTETGTTPTDSACLFCIYSASILHLSLSIVFNLKSVCMGAGQRHPSRPIVYSNTHGSSPPHSLPSPYSHPKFMPWWLNLIKNNMGNNQESAQSWITSFYGHAPAPAVSKRPDNINKRKRQREIENEIKLRQPMAPSVHTGK